MEEQIDPRRLLVQVAQILENLNIPYFVSGGVAVLVWGRPRFTADIDIVVNMKSVDIERLEKALIGISDYGYIDETAIREALERQGEFNFIDGNTGVKVDFWVSKGDAFDRLQFKRRIVKEVLGQKIDFISAEDLILTKLLWHKESSSSRQLEDAESIFKISGDGLDLNYLKTWAEKLNILELLDKFIPR